MKNTVLTLAGLLSVSVLAADYTWTGGGTDAGSWNDAANWEPSGIPGGGDTATFTTSATVTDGITVASGELSISAGTGASVELSGVISGDGSVYFRLANSGATRIVLSGANVYSGGTTVESYNGGDENYGIWLRNAAAFGSNRNVLHKGGRINLDLEGATYSYDFTPSTGSVSYNVYAVVTIDGCIADEDYAKEMSFTCKNAGAKLTVTGKVGGINTTHVNIRSRTPQDNQALTFAGGLVTVQNIRPNTTGDGWSGGRTALGGYSKAARMVCSYNSYVFLADNIIDPATILDFTGYCDGEKGIFLNGHDQTVNRIISQYTDSTKNMRHISSDSPATLTMRPSASSLDNMTAVNGAVTLVMDALDSAYVQQFSNRVSGTSGALISSNGTLRIGANATFHNVPLLAAASNGVIEITSEVYGAFNGVENITVEGNGKIIVPSDALNPSAVNVRLGENSRLELSGGTTLDLASLEINGRKIPHGIYADGTIPQISGAVSVPVVISEDSTGVWTGGGSSQNASDSGNWEGGYPGKIPVTFAAGGTGASLDCTLSISELKFDTPENLPAFSISANEANPDAKIMLCGDIVMTNSAHASGHTNTVSVPIVFAGDSAEINVHGKSNGLVLGAPLIQNGSTLAITRSGSGTLFLNATNSMRTAGTTTFIEGTTYLTGGALGGTAENPLSIHANAANASSADGIDFHFSGGVHNNNFTFTRTTGNNHEVTFDRGTTNIINGFLKMQNTYTFYFDFAGDSRTVINGGFEEPYVWGHALCSRLYRGSVLEIREKPLRATQNPSLNTRFFAYSSEGTGDDAKIIFAATGNISTNGIYFGGPSRIEFETDFAFDADSNGHTTPLGLMKVATINNNDNYKATVVDLKGHSQRFGSLQTPAEGHDSYGWLSYWGHSENSYFTSELPATLHVVQSGRPNAADRPWTATFRGAVALVKEGGNTLTLAGENTTTGKLEVADGRLDFAGNGSWTDAGEVVVSGGTLALDRLGRIGAVDLSVSGGTVEIAAGVAQRVKSLKALEDGQWREIAPGRYFASRLPGVISGEGSIIVAGAGTRIVIR